MLPAAPEKPGADGTFTNFLFFGTGERSAVSSFPDGWVRFKHIVPAKVRGARRNNMARLILSAVSAEIVSGATGGAANLYVSVSQATNGKPVTGLTETNFRATL